MNEEVPGAEGVVAESLKRNGPSIVPILQDIQDRYGYLPERSLRMLAQVSGISLVEIYHAATFYRSFSLVPRGRHRIILCNGTTCHVRGSPKLITEVSGLLGIGPGEVTPDGEFSLDTVNCLGCCAFAPVMVIDGKYYGNLTAQEARRILDSVREGVSSGVAARRCDDEDCQDARDA